MAKILAIETATEACSAALLIDGEVRERFEIAPRRHTDLILPMIAVSTTKAAYTIQLCLLDFNGEFIAREHYGLAMTVVSLVPTTLVFVFLQKYITTGIASTGIK